MANSAQVYSTQRYEPGQEIDQGLKEEFTDYRKSRDETYKADKKALDEEMRTEKAVIEKSEATAAEKKHSQEDLSLRIKASKAELKKEFEKPEAAVYKDYLAEHAPASDKHLQELWRVAVTQQDRERLAAIETDRATVRAGANPIFSRKPVCWFKTRPSNAKRRPNRPPESLSAGMPS
jgi:hypothetical protein